MKTLKRRLYVKSQRSYRTFQSNQGWRTVAGRRIFFRSGWEVSFARYLQFLKDNNQIKDWQHEPQTFWFEKIKRGTRSYLPDFKVIRLDNSHYWVEVKGYMDSKSKTKISRFQKYYPKEQLFVIDSKWFYEQKRKFPMLTEGWENEFTEGSNEECGLNGEKTSF